MAAQPATRATPSPSPLPLLPPASAATAPAANDSTTTLRAVADRQRSRTLAALRADKSEATLLREIEAGHATIDRLIEQQAEQVNLPPRACQAGCGYCCHLMVVVTVPDVLRIAAHIRAATGRASIAIPELDALCAKLSPLSPQQRSEQREPCVWLDRQSGYCRIYELRPAACRGWHSFDLEACLAGFGAPRGNVQTTVWPTQRALAQGVVTGIQDALTELGVDAHYVHFADGLRIALAEPDAGPRWLGGADVFAAARVTLDDVVGIGAS